MLKGSELKLEFINEFQIDNTTSKKLNRLLKKCFADTDYEDRDYFKQLPHYRILAKEGKEIIGQVGIDFRAMNLNGKLVNVFGVIDLCVDPEFQRQGIGKALMLEFEKIASNNTDKIDFLFLVTDSPEFYEGLGYKIADITTIWLKIDQGKNLGIGKEKISDSFFMVKGISGNKWTDGELDLLGYMY